VPWARCRQGPDPPAGHAADAGGLWTLQTAIFPENRASTALHQSAGFRTLVVVRECIGQHHGVWCDTVFLERHHSAD
jgi:L-amino acid N-acyltransferase YncA